MGRYEKTVYDRNGKAREQYRDGNGSWREMDGSPWRDATEQAAYEKKEEEEKNYQPRSQGMGPKGW